MFDQKPLAFVHINPSIATSQGQYHFFQISRNLLIQLNLLIHRIIPGIKHLLPDIVQFLHIPIPTLTHPAISHTRNPAIEPLLVILPRVVHLHHFPQLVDVRLVHSHVLHLLCLFC